MLSQHRWTLWDGFQTLPRRSNLWLTREDVILPHPTDDLEGRETVLQRTRTGRSGRKGTAFKPCPAAAVSRCVDELAHLYEEGASIDALARRYGVHRTTIIVNSIGEACPDAASPGK